MTCSAGKDAGTIYCIVGSFRNLILSATYETENRQGLDRGAITLMLTENGKKLIGILVFYGDRNHEILHATHTWYRDKVEFDEEYKSQIASTSGKGVYAVGTIIGGYEFNEKLEYQYSRKVRWETTFWHPVDIASLKLSKLFKKLYNKFHGRSSLTIRELEADEWDIFCEQLNSVSTPFRNLGIWAGLLQSPEYQNEVMILFSHMLQHFNMRIIQFGVRFPDAIVERKNDGKWQKQYIEFELRLSGFQTHLPDCKVNEHYVIVCWEDNWVHPKKSGFEVIELKTELEKIL